MQSKLNAQLDDERKKLEDLQFRLEEETITRTELESNVETLKAEMETIRQQMKSDAELLTKSDSEVVDALRERLREADQRRESEVFGLQEEVVRKEESVLQLEASVEKRNTELANCQKRLLELEQELDSTRQRTDRQIESIDELNMRITREETAKQELSDECKQLSAQLTDTEKRLQNLEDKLRAAADGKHELESVLDGKEAAERQLEHSLLETKRKYEKFEAEVHSLERELQQIRCECDDESRRRRDAEDKCAVLSSMNHTLDLKCEELLRTSGANSDLLLKVNTEVMDKQREFQQREKQWKQELEVKRRENEARSDELRVQSIELEDRKSLLDRTERKLADMEAELKHMDQELKLARSDCDEKDQTLQELRHQVSDLRQKLTAEARDQEMTKGDLEYKLQDMEKELAVKSQELSGQKQEHRDLKDQKFELELERDKYRRDADRLEKACADKQDTVDALREDMKRMSDEFAEHRVAIEQQLTESSATGSALKELGQEIEKQREACREVEDENQSLKDDNRHLRQKVEELRDDIEENGNNSGHPKRSWSPPLPRAVDARHRTSAAAASLPLITTNTILAAGLCLTAVLFGLPLDKRHREVLQEFEYECERLAGKAETAAALAEDRAHRLRDVEEQQGVAIDQFRRQAELEKRALEATLNELEVKVRESIAANAEATRRRLQEADNEAGVGAAAAADSYEQQIEFLNSVIVDMQKKNDELRCRVQVLEEIGLDEFDFSNVFNNPASGNGNNGHNNGHQSGGRPTGTNGHIRAPRKFCDICDVFDTHETEDCPQQSSAAAIISEALSGHTYYRASRSEHRPFCLQCERFGHNTEHCPDAETF
ncbi:unnamed protein product [Medioppia subpectinata]|uniref:CLIP1 zinc knuckle domain-containing protein n=1 Tax=Medioppia subpectinata TaxID=1979941 RepID=A0A7R9KMA3_9ACAR|nr:unnamed protein product [Medioppia subpectinata]CAG2104994.1 unnamed protein product [Medioppia subpectinata]